MTLNTRPYTISNALPQGDGWDLNDAGEPVVTSRVESQIQANIQPHSARVRDLEGGGFITLHGIKMLIDRNADGSWPDVQSGKNRDRRLPTQVAFNGDLYEVTKVKDTWKHGLMPHLYAEAMLLEADLPTGPSSDDVVVEVDGVEETIELEW